MKTNEMLMGEALSRCEMDESCIVVFDLDGTLLEGDLGETLFYVLLFIKAIHGSIEDIPFLLQTIGEKDFLKSISHTKEITILKSYILLIQKKQYSDAYILTSVFIESFSDEEIQRAAFLTINTFSTQPINLYVEEYPILLYVKYDTLIHSFLSSLSEKRNCSTYIVSASPQSVVEAFCSLGKLSHVVCIGTTSHQEMIPYGMGKVKVLKDIGVEKWYVAFGNSVGDKEMLDLAEVPVLRNATEANIIEYAKEHNWIII